MNKTVLVTGATSGIGTATVGLLARHGYRCIITGRREDRLEELKRNLISAHKVDVHTLCFDIRSLRATKDALDSLPERFSDIDILINNAGLAAGMSPLHEGNISDWEQMIDTNIKGLLYISRLVTPQMVARHSGHIINVSSIAGKETYPQGNVYCATKHAVQSLTKAMRLDLLPYGIKVSSVAPGAVNTEFSTVRFKGDRARADAVYQGFTPLLAEDIAETILFILTRPAHVNIDDILITPSAQAYSRDFNRSGIL